MWDRLPQKANSSILRLDHIQPIGTDQKAYKCTPFCLGSDGLKILDEWVQWLMTGCLQADGVLDYFRKELLELE
jgi:hypothetical protein